MSAVPFGRSPMMEREGPFGQRPGLKIFVIALLLALCIISVILAVYVHRGFAALGGVALMSLLGAFIAMWERYTDWKQGYVPHTRDNIDGD